MPQLLRDMEESYRQRLEAEVAALEKKMATGGAAAGSTALVYRAGCIGTALYVLQCMYVCAG